MNTRITFNTSKFSGFDYPWTSLVLSLQEFRILSISNTINVIIEVFRNVSSILSPRPTEWVMVDSKYQILKGLYDRIKCTILYYSTQKIFALVVYFAHICNGGCFHVSWLL